MTNNEYQQLVEFLGRRFDEIDQRFTAIDERFTAIDERFVAIDQRFVVIDQRFVTMEQRFEARFDTLEQQLRDVLGHFGEVYRRLERLEQEYYAITQALRRIETLLVDERGKREILERSMDELKRQALALQARIDELEQRLRTP